MIWCLRKTEIVNDKENTKKKWYIHFQFITEINITSYTWVWSLVWEDPLEKEMATHSSTVALKIPWTEERGRLHSMGSQRVPQDWATSLSFFLSLVNHILSELSTMTRSSWVALHGMAHSFTELDKAAVQVISLISFLWLWFSFCLPWDGWGGLWKLLMGETDCGGNWILFWWAGPCSVNL